jgi:hypothetical protein
MKAAQAARTMTTRTMGSYDPVDVDLPSLQKKEVVPPSTAGTVTLIFASVVRANEL